MNLSNMDMMSMFKKKATQLKEEEEQMTILNEMLNDSSTSMRANKIRIIEIDSIFNNPLNNMPIENIEEMLEVINTDGQLVPLIVYKEANNHYVLISGERRWTALKQAGYETAPCVIIDKPDNEFEERLAIEAANSQREDTAEIQKLRVENYAIVFDGYKTLGKIQSGVLKRDWIGERMNLSGRQVQRYLTQESSKELSNIDDLENTEDDKDADLKKLLKAVESFRNKVLKFNNNDQFDTENYRLLTALSIASNEASREAEILMNRAEEEKKAIIARQ